VGTYTLTATLNASTYSVTSSTSLAKIVPQELMLHSNQFDSD
jgi:hypothetical protein